MNKDGRRDKTSTASGSSDNRRHEPDGSARQDIIDRISRLRRLPQWTRTAGATRHRPHQALQATAAMDGRRGAKGPRQEHVETDCTRLVWLSNDVDGARW